MTDLLVKAGVITEHGFDWNTFLRRYGAVLVLVLLIIFNIAFTENWLTLRNILFVQLRQAAPTAIVALGMALIIATGGIDLSVGAVVALSGQITAVMLLSGVPAAAALPLGILVGRVAGLFNGTLGSRFGIQPMSATLVLFTAGRGLAQVVTGGRIQPIDHPIVEFLGLGVVAGVPISVVCLVVIAAVAVAGTTPAGGTFSPGRTIIGVLMLRLLQNTLVAHGIPREVAQVAQGLIIVAAIYLQRRSRDAR